jgi:type I restriction enzyme R subunit
MKTDTTERGLERLICTALTGHPCDPPQPGVIAIAEQPAAYGGAGWIGGDPNDYDREYCVDLAQLAAFLRETQPQTAEALALNEDGPTRRKFLARLQGQITGRGIIDVLRHGIKHGPHDLDLFYATPSPRNEKAKALYEANHFSVTRQLRYSRDETQLARTASPSRPSRTRCGSTRTTATRAKSSSSSAAASPTLPSTTTRSGSAPT